MPQSSDIAPGACKVSKTTFWVSFRHPIALLFNFTPLIQTEQFTECSSNSCTWKHSKTSNGLHNINELKLTLTAYSGQRAGVVNTLVSISIASFICWIPVSNKSLVKSQSIHPNTHLQTLEFRQPVSEGWLFLCSSWQGLILYFHFISLFHLGHSSL